MLNQEPKKTTPEASGPKAPSLSLVRQELSDKVKEAFANWIVDTTGPCVVGEKGLKSELSTVKKAIERSVMPHLERLGETVEQSLASEIAREALMRDPDVEDEQVAEEVIGRMERELAIMRNEVRLAASREAALFGKNPSKQRLELLSRCRRGLEFAIGEESTPVFFDALRPMLSAIKAFGVTDLDEKMEKAFAEHRDSARFRAPVFELMLNRVMADKELLLRTLSGLSASETHELVCESARLVYPTPSDYAAARTRAAAASGHLMENVLGILEKSGNSFAEAVALMFRSGPLPESMGSLPSDMLKREIEAVYGGPA